MKYFLSIFLLLLTATTFMSCKPKPADNQNNFPQNLSPLNKPMPVDSSALSQHKYAIKSGIVIYETNIAGTIGKKIFYFDDFGKKEREEYYEGDILKEILISDGRQLFKIIPYQKKPINIGTVTDGFAYRVSWKDIDNKLKQEGKAILNENMIIVGMHCESYKIDNAGIITYFAGWGGICLFSHQVSALGNALSRAVSFRQNPQIPFDKFLVPK